MPFRVHYPIKERGGVPLPPRTLLQKRGFTWGRIDSGKGDELLLISAKLHHIDKDTKILQKQLTEIVRFWNQPLRKVVLA